jgi:3-dehydroquinate synthase
MEASPVSEHLVIQSHTGPYRVDFHEEVPDGVFAEIAQQAHFLIDSRVARLYEAKLGCVARARSTILIEATEANKSLQQTIPVFERLIANGVRREHTLVAIGGGIIQDITCFIASTLFRGVPWQFAPTTLLAQADSCIGSKSSINLGEIKNVLGTFNPPRHVRIYRQFLDSLEPRDLHSGVGEILKVHAIAGPEEFDRVAHDFDRLFTERAVLLGYIRAALRIKQSYIEQDEFDRGIRNIFNYGHSFGHAIESATDYRVPHGIAVSMGMDMANFIAVRRGLLAEVHFQRMHPVLARNYALFAAEPISLEVLLKALSRDKKNTSAALRLILPTGKGAAIEPVSVTPDEAFRGQCAQFLAGLGR